MGWFKDFLAEQKVISDQNEKCGWESWEKEFDEKFSSLYSRVDYEDCGGQFINWQDDNIKSFIRKLLESKEKEWREKYGEK